jgi:MFS family permease
MPRRSRSASPALAALVAEGFLSRLSFGLVSFALPLFGHRLGMSLAEIGLLVSFNLVVAIPLKPAGGWMADRIGLKTAVVIAIALRSGVSALLIMAQAPWQLFAIRALHGVSIAIRDPATAATLAEQGGSKAVASSFAWYQTAKTLAGSLGKAASGLALAVTGGSFRLVFAVAFALSILPLGVVARYLPRPAGKVASASELVTPELVTPAPPPRPRRRDPRLLRYFGLGFLVTGSAYMLSNLFPLLATEYAGLSEAEAGALYLLATAAALSGPIFGWLADHRGPKLVLSIRSAANVASSLLYLFAPNTAGFAAGRVLDDTGKAAFRPAWGAVMASASADGTRRARTMGWLTMGEDAGEVAGPIVAGVIWAAWGAPALLVARAAVAAVAEVYALRVVPSPKDSLEPEAPAAAEAHAVAAATGDHT